MFWAFLVVFMLWCVLFADIVVAFLRKVIRVLIILRSGIDYTIDLFEQGDSKESGKES